MTPTASWQAHVRAGFARWVSPGYLALVVSALGLALRVEHAITFDGLGRGADYERNVSGVYWMLKHWRPFDFTPDLNWSVGYHPPLWFALGAVILKVLHSERAIAFLAVFGWAIRQFLLSRILREAASGRKWSALAALSINAFLPISVLTDGKVNPEGLHTSMFAVAIYALWRMEREAQQLSGITSRSAVAFGAFAGLAVLTKGTGGVLPLVAVIVLAWNARRLIPQAGWHATWRRLLRPGLLAAAMWCVVAGWWCGPNLVKYGHPFPHGWDRGIPETEYLLETPTLYRRPLGWALPFSWGPYLEAPIMMGAETPRPNLWAMLVSGTWSDLINRGFCRLPGGGMNNQFWDANPVSGDCVRLLRTLMWVGCFITVAALLALIRVTLNHVRTGGQLGSLALPVAIVTTVTFVGLFGLKYPLDGTAVVNARYLLPVSMPMSACLGIALGQLRSLGPKRTRIHALMFVAIGLVGVLVIYERWGG